MNNQHFTASTRISILRRSLVFLLMALLAGQGLIGLAQTTPPLPSANDIERAGNAKAEQQRGRRATTARTTREEAQARELPQPQEKLIRHEHAIPNRYIVVFKSPETPKTQTATLEQEQAPTQRLSREMASEYSAVVENVFTDALQGFSGYLSAAEARKLSEDPRVAFVEEDAIAQATAVQTNATWGLDRIDQRERNLDRVYSYQTTGKGVNVYVLDTGIRISHAEFEGRARVAFDAVGDGMNGWDCAGHGTHVAGTIGGKTYGVAKNVTLHAVRVLDCSGRGSLSNIIRGVDWVTANHIKPAVANMSLGSQASNVVDWAVNNSIAAGVTYVVAAGNDNQDAQFYSPARVPAALTVGATAGNDTRSEFSNYGIAVDVFAPGSDITSASHTSDTGTTSMNGTSMAAPHVAGAVALLLETNRAASPEAVTRMLLTNATPNRVSNVGYGSPNLLLHSLSNATNAPCTNCASYQGALATEGSSAWQPDGNYYYSASPGYQQGWLVGSANTDFDLYLWWWNGSQWVRVASADGSSSQEQINYYGAPGYYIWQITAAGGKGNYQFWLQRP